MPLKPPPPRPRRKARATTPVPPILSGMTFLETASVQPATRDSYCRLLEVFLRWSGLVTVAVGGERLDHLLCQYFHRLYTEGRGPEAGSKLIAAILFVYPAQAGRGRPALGRALRALKGWKRKMPAATRQPLPYFVVMGIGSDLRRRGLPLMALCWLLMFDTYMRPGECTDLQASQIVPPQPGVGMKQAAVLLNPGYREKFSKTGELDESLLVSRRWLSEMIADYALTLMPSAPLWPFSMNELRKAFMETCAGLHLEHLRPVLYMARHSGASTDRLENRASLAEVQVRGRWRSDTSVRRYEKRALVMKAAASLTPVQKRKFVQDEIDLPAALRADLRQRRK